MFILVSVLIILLIGVFVYKIYKIIKRFNSLNSNKIIKKNLLFSYGSNSIKQIKERLKINDEIIYYSAHIKDYIRIFAGMSKKWNNGGVASIYKSKGYNVYGIAIELTDSQLSILDTYENGYTRNIMKCIINSEEHICYVYVKDNHLFKNLPSIQYLKAINEMLNNRKVNNERKILIKGIVKQKVVHFGYWSENNKTINTD